MENDLDIKTLTTLKRGPQPESFGLDVAHLTANTRFEAFVEERESQPSCYL
jgi:hypothetical protein